MLVILQKKITEKMLYDKLTDNLKKKFTENNFRKHLQGKFNFTGKKVFRTKKN